MKETEVDSQGNVRCPECGAIAFDSKRTGKAKVAGVVTLGVGVVAMPKRLKCRGCGTNLKRGSGKRWKGEVGEASTPSAHAATAMPDATPPETDPLDVDERGSERSPKDAIAESAMRMDAWTKKTEQRLAEKKKERSEARAAKGTFSERMAEARAERAETVAAREVEQAHEEQDGTEHQHSNAIVAGTERLAAWNEKAEQHVAQMKDDAERKKAERKDASEKRKENRKPKLTFSEELARQKALRAEKKNKADGDDT